MPSAEEFYLDERRRKKLAELQKEADARADAREIEAFARDVEDYLVADGDAAWRLATRWARTGDSSGRGAATPFADPEVRPWVRRVCDGAGRSVAVDGIVMSVDHGNLPWHASDAVPCVSWDASDEVFFST